jgi:Domain of unknown function (DUF5919)
MSHRHNDIAVAFAVNIVAGAVLLVATRNLTYALTAIVLIQFGLMLFLGTPLWRRKVALGIVSTTSSSPEGSELARLAEGVTAEFAFWGISAKSLLSNDSFNRLMIQKARGTCVFRFLLISPTSEHLVRKAVEEGDAPEAWQKEIEANLVRLARFRDEHHLNLEVRAYDQRPTFRCVFVNSDLAYLGWYPPGAQGRNSPFLVIRNSHTSLYHPVRAEFESLWSRARCA